MFKRLFLSLILLSIAPSFSFAEELQLVPVKFDLAKEASLTKSCKKSNSVTGMSQLIADKKFLEHSKPVAKVTEYRIDKYGKQVEDTVYLYPAGSQALGLSQKQALLASRDDISTSACSSYHEQGDLANRWCHASIGIGVSKGAQTTTKLPPAVAGLAGTGFWMLKEKVVDQNPSSGDLVYSYEDTLGTKRSKFSITIFADSMFDSHFKKFQPFKESTPLSLLSVHLDLLKKSSSANY